MFNMEYVLLNSYGDLFVMFLDTKTCNGKLYFKSTTLAFDKTGYFNWIADNTDVQYLGVL